MHTLLYYTRRVVSTGLDITYGYYFAMRIIKVVCILLESISITMHTTSS